MTIAASDRDRFVSDPRFVSPRLARLLSDAYAEDCAGRIRSGVKTELPRLQIAEAKHTTHVSCVDRDGMVGRRQIMAHRPDLTMKMPHDTHILGL
jgi:gamma-glutamyltranspeptidase / glutathione hydrolase